MADIYVNAGVVSSNVTVIEQNMFVMKNGTADKTIVNSNGSMFVSNGGIASRTSVLKATGWMQVENGAIATSTTVSSGNLHVAGSAKETTVTANANMFVSNGGVTLTTTVKGGGQLTVSAGGSADDVSVKGTGVMDVLAGGIATNANIISGGIANIRGKTENTTVNKAGGLDIASLIVFDGGNTTSTTINEAGYMHISNGGNTTSTTVNSGGFLYVSNGGQATSSFVNDGGHIDVFEGGLASDARVSSGGSLSVSYGGSASNTFLSGGLMYASNGATVTGVMALQGANLYIYEGAAVTGLVENGGYVSFLTNASATFLSNTFSGLTLSNESATVHSMTKAVDITLNDSGHLYVYAGGTATGTTVNSGGQLHVSSGGKITGKMTFADGAYVTIHQTGAIVDFDISALSPNNDVLINNLSKLNSFPTYTLTVSATQAKGTYNLAEGVSSFTKSITVVNTFGSELGTLTVAGGETNIGGRKYTLALTGSGLTVTLGEASTDTTPPEVSNVAASIMTLTNQNVTVTADFTDDVEVATKLYKIGTGAWTDYVDGVVVTENGTVYFKAVDTSGNESIEASYTVSNIDKVKPTITDITPSTTALTDSVTVTANFADNVSLASKQYKIGDGAWTDYTTGVTVTSNTTLSFKAVDTVGNESTAQYVVTNINSIFTGDLENTTVNITSGMSAVNVNINTSGRLNILDGGVASNTNVNEKGEMGVSSGGVASNININSRGWMFIGSGGRTDDATVNSDGIFTVGSGGTANRPMVNSGGVFYISSGGTATNIIWTPCEGKVIVFDGGYATFSNSYSGVYYGEDGKLLESAASMDGKTLKEHCSIYIMDGGLATNTLVDDGEAFVWSGGMAENTTVKNFFYVSSGGTANNITVSYGALYVSSGGTATNIVWTPGEGNVHIYDGGYATLANSLSGVYYWSAGMLLSHAAMMENKYVDNQMYVMNGGYANNTTVDHWADIYIWSGGVADNTTVTGSATINVSFGGMASNTTVNKDGILLVSSGGMADNTAINSDGLMRIFSGGTAINTTVNDGGKVDINGVADNTTVTGSATINVSFGGMANNTTVNKDGKLYVSSGGMADNTTINSNGLMTIFNGGTAGNTMVTGGILGINSGSVAKDITVTDGSLYNSGKMTGSINLTGGLISAFSNSVVDFDISALSPANAVLINNLSLVTGKPTYTLTVSNTQANGTYNLAGNAASWGDRTITVVNTSGATLGTISVAGEETDIGGVKYKLALDEGNNLTVTITGTITIDTTLPAVSNIVVSTTAPTNKSVTVTADFTDNVGIATKQYKIGDGAWTNYVDGAVIEENGTVYFKATDTSGNESIEASHVVSNIDKVKPTITDITPSTTELAASVTVTAIFSDDVALASKQYKIGDGEWQDYVDGVTVAENTTVFFKAIDAAGNVSDEKSCAVTNICKVFTGDLENTTVNITSGMSAVNVNANFKGILNVFSGGLAENTIVNSKGELRLRDSDSIANGVTVNAVGLLRIFSGGKATGQMTFEEGAGVLVSSGGVIDFDISAISPKNAVLVNMLSFIQGEPTYTLTVSATQTEGKYNLAGDATEFSETITVVDTLGTELGTISIADGMKDIDGVKYTLALDEGGNLSVTVGDASTPDTTLPTVSNIVASTTAPTNKSVTVTADFTDNVGIATKQYKIGDNSWTNYVDGVTITENGTVYFKAVDMSGNESSGTDSITVSNIDKVKPTITDITPSTTEKTDSVTVTANFADDVDLASSQYKVGLGDWTDYTTGVTVTANTTIYFKAIDTAGNEATAQYEVTNIETTEPDTTKPEISNIKADITTPTNGNVVVTAEFADNVGIATKQYKIGDGAWTDYVDGVTLTENGTVYFKATDTSGNESNEENFLVSNIDRTPPAKPTASASTEAPTNSSVNVSATFAGDSVKNEYSMDGTNWALYPGLVKFDDNGTVYFRATDEAGNVSDVETYSVTNIDKVPPAKPTASADITEKTTGSVTVTATFSGDSTKKEYSLDGLIWQDYTAPIVFNANGKAYFRAFDAAGNQSEIGGYDVTNIETTTPDTTKPTVTNIAASTTALTNNNVFVTADFLDNVAVKSKLYKLGSGAWTAYADGVVVTENATVYFKAVDTSDNESDVAEYAVTNIDKVAPTITNITHSPTAPAKSVTVTATFADNIGLATKQYKIGTSGAWTDYVDGVIMTENDTVYFWAVDTAGNESSTVSHTVTNIEPTGSSITGDITGETKDVPAGWTALNVNVNTGGKLNVLDGGVASNTNVNAGGRLYVSSGGIARDTTVNDGGLIEGSGCEIDGIVVNSGGSLLLYSGAKLTGQMTFASGAEVIPFVGSILDFDLTQTEPGSPALVNDLSILMGTPTYTITVDNSQALGTYKLAGGAAGFNKTITVVNTSGTELGTLTVDGGATKLGDVYLTLALSGSDLTFTISEDSGGGIIPDNKPDDGKNDYLYKKKADPEWNNANIHVTNEITGNGEVRLDLPGTIDTEDGKHNLFGHDKDNMDTGDVAQVEVNDPAKLTFTIDSNAAGTFFVYEDGFDKKGNRKMITVKKVTVKAGKLATLKDVCLTSTGKYYVAMTAKNVKKVGTEGLYNVNVIESKFFVDADEGANKNNTADEGKTISVGRDQDKNIVLDGNPMKGSTEFNSFVGFTDGKDYAKLDLTDSAYLKFHVMGDGDGKAKFTIWKQTKGTTGKLSKVTSVSLPAKKVYDATTKAQFLDTSKYTYYVSMECSDEAKGKGVYYNVQITDDAVFFDSNDDGRNNVLYDKKAKSFYVEDANHHFESTTIGTETKVKLDTNPVADTDWENFVGYQDATDYAKIKLTSDGKLNFHLEATGDATFTVYKKGQDKKGNDTLETIQTAKLAVASGASKTEKDIQISDLEAGEYYVLMKAESTKANDTGSVFYNVTATLDPSASSSLAMPETDNLGISDALSFGQYDADALADASASSLAELDDKTGWLNIATLV